MKANNISEFPQLPTSIRLPRHLLLIPDGNRRWARQRGFPTFEGHRRGFNMANKLIRAAFDWGIQTMTIWAYSTDNWKREEREINYLMKLYERMIDKNLNEAIERGSRIIHLGRKDRIPKRLMEKLTEAEKRTRTNTKHILNVALDYGGRDELLRAVKRMLKAGLKPADLTDEKFSSYLDTGNQPYPDPDFVIRTSGELRLSGILPWQSDYAELYFTKLHFPDFTPEMMRKALMDYSRRQRRFGGNTSILSKDTSGESVPKIIRRLQV